MTYHNGIVMCTVYAQYNAFVLPLISNIEHTIIPDPTYKILKTCVRCNVIETRWNRHWHYNSSLHNAQHIKCHYVKQHYSNSTQYNTVICNSCLWLQLLQNKIICSDLIFGTKKVPILNKMANCCNKARNTYAKKNRFLADCTRYSQAIGELCSLSFWWLLFLSLSVT